MRVVGGGTMTDMHIGDVVEAERELRYAIKETKQIMDRAATFAGKAWKNHLDGEQQLLRMSLEQYKEQYEKAQEPLKGYEEELSGIRDFVEEGKGSKEFYERVLDEYETVQDQLSDMDHRQHMLEGVHQMHQDLNGEEQSREFEEMWTEAYDTVEVARRKVYDLRGTLDHVKEQEDVADETYETLGMVIGAVTTTASDAFQKDHAHALDEMTFLNSALAQDYREMHNDLVDKYKDTVDKIEDLPLALNADDLPAYSREL